MGQFDGYGLIPEFAEKLARVFEVCIAQGYDFRISQGLRTPQKQAEYYCKWNKRTPKDIEKAATKLRRDGAVWLSDILLSYKDIPRDRRWLTSALPGAGWHQWGEAADSYCYRNGRMVEDGDDPCYKFYADTAKRFGLTAGYYFTNQDSGHLQNREKPSAASTYTWSYIDEVMKKRFGDKDVVALGANIGAAALVTSITAPVTASLSTSKYFKDSDVLIDTPLAPSSIIITKGTSGTLRALADIYNRVGGLLETFGKLVGADPVAALAVWYVESGGRNLVDGLPVLRLENHKLFAKWGTRHTAEFDKHFKFGGRNGVPGASHKGHEYRVAETDPFKKSHVDRQEVEYEAFRLAEQLAGREAACWSSSWGGPQIMGFNFDICGYASATEMGDAFASDERWQVLGFADFCRDKGLIDEIQSKNWNRFGTIYNGDGAVYGPKIKAAYDLKSRLLQLPRAPASGFGGGLASAGFPSLSGEQPQTAGDAVG